MLAQIQPAALDFRLEPQIAASKLASLLDDVRERGGVESYVDALRNKHQVFAAALPERRPDSLPGEVTQVLLECVFPARRKLAEPLKGLEQVHFAGAILELVYSKGSILERMRDFCDKLPVSGRKQEGAAWDLAAEILHFRFPELLPLMTRWVWDSQTMSGAVREFVAGADTVQSLPLEVSPEGLEGVRAWFVEHLEASGFYRDLPFITDLILARGYADYMDSISGSLGIFKSEFGGQQDPMDMVVKLLGIDERRNTRPARNAPSLPLH